jgi:hypothetical protein
MVNVLLLLTMTLTLASGLMQSKGVLSFLHLSGGLWIRQLHTATAYWALLLTGAHVGLHAKKAPLAAVFALATFGTWAAIDRNILAKLIAHASFDYWPPSRPALLFYAEQAAIAGLAGCASGFLASRLKKRPPPSCT